MDIVTPCGATSHDSVRALDALRTIWARQIFIVVHLDGQHIEVCRRRMAIRELQNFSKGFRRLVAGPSHPKHHDATTNFLLQ